MKLLTLKISEKLDWDTGVPQGSMLGPILYLVSVNTLPSCISKYSNVYLFADDTTLVVGNKDLRIAQTKIQNDYVNLQKWSHDHGLSINKSKTKCLQITRTGFYDNQIKILHHSHECLHGKLKNCKCNKITLN